MASLNAVQNFPDAFIAARKTGHTLMNVREIGSNLSTFKQIYSKKNFSMDIKFQCTLRFLCRKPAIRAALNKQEVVNASSGEMKKEAPAKQSANIGELSCLMAFGNAVLLLEIALSVFSVLENLNTSLQQFSLGVILTFQVVEYVKHELRHLRYEEMFHELLKKHAAKVA